MAYRVLDNMDLNVVASSGTSENYKTMVESALNNMERQGYRLVHIEPPMPDATDSYYIFHRSQ